MLWYLNCHQILAVQNYCSFVETGMDIERNIGHVNLYRMRERTARSGNKNAHSEYSRDEMLPKLIAHCVHGPYIQ